KYAEVTYVPVSHVAHPAVLADIVYRKNPDPPAALKPAPSIPVRAKLKLKRIVKSVIAKGGPATGTSTAPAAKKPAAKAPPAEPKAPRIGLVVTRAGIFADNRIDFTEDDQRKFWLETIASLEAKGYDYRLFTTGHFSDEVFLDSLVRDSGVPAKK